MNVKALQPRRSVIRAAEASRLSYRNPRSSCVGCVPADSSEEMMDIASEIADCKLWFVIYLSHKQPSDWYR